MKISNELATHEAGHLVVGLRIGIDEQGIIFSRLQPGEAAGAFCKNLDRHPKKAIIRSLSGLLAHFHLLPDTIALDLRRAYAHSIIIDRDHPHFHTLALSERDFLSGAKTDMRQAWSFANALKPDDPKQALACLRRGERKARSLIVECAANISRVVDDIHLWSAEPDREFDGLALYPPDRAKAAIS